MNTQTTGTTAPVVTESAPVVLETALVTPIQAATRLGKAPQVVYGMLRNKKVPAEFIVQMAKGDGTFRELLTENFFAWFASRPSVRTSGAPSTKLPAASAVVVTQASAEELMNLMAAKLEILGDKKFVGLAAALKAASNFSVLPALEAGPVAETAAVAS
jgi:hypothetical protein